MSGLRTLHHERQRFFFQENHLCHSAIAGDPVDSHHGCALIADD